MNRSTILRLGGLLLLTGVLWIAMAVSAQALSSDAVWPEHPGYVVANDGKLLVDESHAEEGYVMACVSSPTKHVMKLRITYNGFQMMYDIYNNGEYVAYPLQMGSGNYTVELFENVKGSKFSAEGKVIVEARLVDENAAFLVPNQYVDYDFDSVTVAESDAITGAKTGQVEIFQGICDYIANNFEYDFVRAKTISSGTLPEVDPCFERRSGICQDLSAVTVCMLRVQGIPSKLIIGYADKYYHAWTVSVVNGKEVFFDPTAAVGALSARKYKTERFY